MPDAQVLADRLDEHVTPLETTDPHADLGDLAPLVDRLADATVVGMGEATHGTREFFRLKHRVFRLLVEELDYRLFGLEANFSETLAINDYVVRGDGDPEDALDGIYFWTWNTEAVLATIEWMREFNDGRPVDDRIRFYGFDVQFTQGPAAALREYLEDVDPTYVAEIDDTLGTLETGNLNHDDGEVDADALASAESLLTDLGDRFERREDEYREGSADVPYDLADQHRRTLEQAVELTRARHEATDDREDIEAFGVRDRNMAENVAWILDHEDADRIALWAHNGHVYPNATPGTGKGYVTMGAHLTERFGDGYYVLGFDFDRGSFQAVEHPDEHEEPDLRAWSVGSIVDAMPVEGLDDDGGDGGQTERDSPERGSPDVEFHEAMHRFDEGMAFVDVAGARTDDELGAWLGERHLCHHIGAVFHEGGDRSRYYERFQLDAELDGLLYVGETTRAVPVEEGDD